MDIKEVRTTRDDSKKVRKLFEKEGWKSAQYWIRRKNIEADQLRKYAKAGQISAIKLLTDEFAITWYYREEDVKNAIEINLAH